MNLMCQWGMKMGCKGHWAEYESDKESGDDEVVKVVIAGG